MLNNNKMPRRSCQVLVLNYGSQYCNLILRRCREFCIDTQVRPANTNVSDVKECNPIAIILSGGPESIYNQNSAKVSSEVWDYILQQNIPILGICYGMQDMHNYFKGKVQPARIQEYGPTKLHITEEGRKDPLLQNIPVDSVVWMSHRDEVTVKAASFVTLATTSNCKVAAASLVEKKLWSVQFHPEVSHTEYSKQLFSNFFEIICKFSICLNQQSIILNEQVLSLQKEVGSKKIFAAVSGGVDSFVATALVYKAIQRRFEAFLIDTGLLRESEVEEVVNLFKINFPDIGFHVIDASKNFFQVLEGIKDPEIKRNRISETYFNVLETAIVKFLKASDDGHYNNAMLLQGTICSDVIESTESNNNLTHKGKIKTHHNVSIFKQNFRIPILEPLKKLHKDEVRELGLTMNLKPEFLYKHPFPGPGLAVRIIGEVTPHRAAIVRQADAIFLEELKKAGEYQIISQAFAVLLPECLTVGVAGDDRTHGMTVILRAVQTSDFMTADWYELTRTVLSKISCRITTEIKEVNRVCYDITSKPPATIEWE